MNEDAAGDGEGNSDTERTRHGVALGAAAVRSGDRVVHTTDLGKEYEYRVAEVDGAWITFETGQMVHRDRFDREAFSVVRTTADPADTETSEAGDDGEPDERTAVPIAPAAGSGDVRSPNAD